jgi:predicted HicB family RNase H-like nuclease
MDNDIKRGINKARFNLQLDARLKEDLHDLSKATGSRSLNDYIASALAEHVGSADSQKKLGIYRMLLKA